MYGALDAPAVMLSPHSYSGPSLGAANRYPAASTTSMRNRAGAQPITFGSDMSILHLHLEMKLAPQRMRWLIRCRSRFFADCALPPRPGARADGHAMDSTAGTG